MERVLCQLFMKPMNGKAYGKQNYYWNVYCLEGNSVVKYNRHNFFDGNENSGEETKIEEEL